MSKGVHTYKEAGITVDIPNRLITIDPVIVLRNFYNGWTQGNWTHFGRQCFYKLIQRALQVQFCPTWYYWARYGRRKGKAMDCYAIQLYTSPTEALILHCNQKPDRNPFIALESVNILNKEKIGSFMSGYGGPMSRDRYFRHQGRTGSYLVNTFIYQPDPALKISTMAPDYFYSCRGEIRLDCSNVFFKVRVRRRHDSRIQKRNTI